MIIKENQMDSKQFTDILEGLWGAEKWEHISWIHTVPPDDTVMVEIEVTVPVTISLTLEDLKITDREIIRDLLYQRMIDNLYARSEHKLNKEN
jgi:hypothetical protein